MASQVPRQLVRSAVIYVLSISVCSALWDVGSYQTLMNCILMSIFAVDVGSYPTLVNLAYYCGSCIHLSLVCKCQLKLLELSFPGAKRSEAPPLLRAERIHGMIGILAQWFVTILSAFQEWVMSFSSKL